MLPIFGTVQNALSVKRCFPFPLSFSPPPPSTNHSLPPPPLSSSQARPHHFPQSRVTTLKCSFSSAPHLCWLVGFFVKVVCMCNLAWHLCHQHLSVCSSGSTQHMWRFRLLTITVSLSPWMQLRCSVFSLDGDLRPWLAAPEVEGGGGEGALLAGCSPLSSSYFSQLTSIAHLLLTVRRPHCFCPSCGPLTHILHTTFVSLFPAADFLKSIHRTLNATVSTLASLSTTIYGCFMAIGPRGKCMGCNQHCSLTWVTHHTDISLLLYQAWGFTRPHLKPYNCVYTRAVTLRHSLAAVSRRDNWSLCRNKS